MHFVDDEDLEAVADRKDRETGDDDIAHVVDARVRGGVDLQDVDVAAFRNLGAGLAAPAGIGRRPVHAVERARKNPGRGGLAHPPRSREHERLREAAAGEGVPERTRHRLLPDDLVEALRPPFACKDLIHHEGYGLYRGPEWLRHISGSSERCCLPALTRFVV